eukprot:1588789-Pyramimonas_sp.AAC.1
MSRLALAEVWVGESLGQSWRCNLEPDPTIQGQISFVLEPGVCRGVPTLRVERQPGGRSSCERRVPAARAGRSAPQLAQLQDGRN